MKKQALRTATIVANNGAYQDLTATPGSVIPANMRRYVYRIKTVNGQREIIFYNKGQPGYFFYSQT